MTKRTIQSGTRHRGFALHPAVFAEGDSKRHVLNSGKAYGGEMVLSPVGRFRLSPKGELPMLAEHNRADLIGAWQDVRMDEVDGAPMITAGGLRWANSEKVPRAGEYQSLWDDALISAMSIGFSAIWLDRSQMPKDHAAYSKDGGWFLDEWEVYEASLVAVGADADSMRGDLTLADGAIPEAAEGDADEADEADEVETAAMWLLQHLVRHHGMGQADAEQAVRDIAEGVPYVPSEDEEPEAADLAGDDPGDDPDEMGGHEDGAMVDVPAGVREAAQRGIDAAAEYGRAAGGPGEATARALVSGQVDADKIREMVVWWARWEDAELPADPPADGGPSATEIRWDQWGGNPEGARWARANDTADDDAGAAADPGDSTAADPDDDAPEGMTLASLFALPSPQTLARLFPNR